MSVPWELSPVTIIDGWKTDEMQNNEGDFCCSSVCAVFISSILFDKIASSDVDDVACASGHLNPGAEGQPPGADIRCLAQHPPVWAEAFLPTLATHRDRALQFTFRKQSWVTNARACFMLVNAHAPLCVVSARQLGAWPLTATACSTGLVFLHCQN